MVQSLNFLRFNFLTVPKSDTFFCVFGRFYRLSLCDSRKIGGIKRGVYIYLCGAVVTPLPQGIYINLNTFSIMAKTNNKQQAQQVAAQQAEQTKAQQSAGKAAAKAQQAQAKADAQHTADLWKIEHAGVNAAIRTLFQVAADDPKTWARMAYIMGAEQGAAFDDSKAMRDRYKAAIRTKAAYVAADGTPLYKVQTGAKGIAEYVAAPTAYTAKAVFSEPLLVALGAKKQQQRETGVYYRDSAVVPAAQAKAAIKAAAAERERINKVKQAAAAAERVKIEGAKAQAQA